MLNKTQSSKRIKFAEEDDTLITNEEKVMKLNDYFSNAVIKRKVPELKNFDPLSENIDYPTLKAIIKYRTHPSIIAVASEFTKKRFSFNTITIEDALKKISILNSSKAIQAFKRQQ